MGRLSEYFARNNGEGRRRTSHYSGMSGKRPGPMEADYDPSNLPPRQRAAGRMVQLLVAMQAAYADGDRRTFDSHVAEFDDVAAIIEDGMFCCSLRVRDSHDPDPDEASLGLTSRRIHFPKWTND